MNSKSPGVGEERYLIKIWMDIWPNLPGLLGANLLFLLWCLPYTLLALLNLPVLALAVAAPTIGPGIVGLIAYVGRLVKDEPASCWPNSLQGFRSGFVSGSLLAAVTAMAIGAHSVALTNALAAEMTGLPFYVWVGQVCILIVLALLHIHSFTLVAVYENGVWDALRNAFILSFAHPMASIAMLSLFVLLYVLIQAVGWGPMIIAPSLIAVFMTNTTAILVARHQPSTLQK